MTIFVVWWSKYTNLRISIYIILFLSLCMSVQGEDDHTLLEGDNTMLESDIDYTLFLKATYAPRLLSEFDSYNLGFVRYTRRGYSSQYSKQYSINDISIFNPLSGVPIWNLLGATSRVRFLGRDNIEGDYNYISPLGFGSIMTQKISAMPSEQRVVATLSTKRYRYRAGGHSSGAIGNKSRYSFGVEVKDGYDGDISGVFTRSILAYVGFSTKFKSGGELSLSLIAAPTQRGGRSSTTKQAAELLEDNLYNPTWGYVDGKVRNSSVSTDIQPIAMATYSDRISDKTELQLSLSLRMGREAQGALSWGDAPDPRPDYYRYMPDFMAGDYLQEVATDMWIANPQINWSHLYNINKLSSSGESLYFCEDRVKEDIDGGGFVSLKSTINDKISFRYGVKARVINSSNYKVMRDLMGGEFYTDLDRYMVDNLLYGDKVENNVQDPSRKIEVGDKFGYDYDINYSDYSGFVNFRSDFGTLLINAGLDVGATSFQRNGMYEKELYEGARSFGESKKHKFNHIALQVSSLLRLTTAHQLSISLGYDSDAPNVNDVLLSPRYRNMSSGNATNSNSYGVDFRYNYLSEWVSCQLTLYATMFTNGADVYSYYDDMFEEYCNVNIYNIEKLHRGVEASVLFSFSSFLDVKVVAGLGRFTYSNNPSVDIVSDASELYLLEGDISHMSGYVVGNAPQRVFSTEVKYNHRGWNLSMIGSVLGGRYIEPVVTRRMKRVYEMASSPESKNSIVLQEKLPAAINVSLRILKNIRLGNERLLSLYVMVDNVLGVRDNIYSGYESSRVRKHSVDGHLLYTPMDSRYMYADGRGFLCGVSYRF